MFGRRYHPLESIVSGMIVKDHLPIPSHPRVEFVRLKLRIGLRLLVELLFEQGENLWMFGFDSGATTAIALAFNFLPVVKFFEPSRDGLSVPFEQAFSSAWIEYSKVRAERRLKTSTQ